MYSTFHFFLLIIFSSLTCVSNLGHVKVTWCIKIGQKGSVSQNVSERVTDEVGGHGRVEGALLWYNKRQFNLREEEWAGGCNGPRGSADVQDIR